MSKIFVHGVGSVSPAGWGTTALRAALDQSTAIQPRDLSCPGYSRPLKIRRVPPASPRPSFVAHPRLRRTSPIGQYAVAAALEALGGSVPASNNGMGRLGIIYCSMSGCVNFSCRFYDETLKDPATASPMIFPETVFNAPASHLGALLGCDAVNYTLVGDPGTFLQGLAMAADWLTTQRVEGCLVIGAEELDWLVAQSFDLFDPEGILGEGAGAIYLRTGAKASSLVELQAVTQSHLFSNRAERAEAARSARNELNGSGPNSLLCDGLQGVPRLDREEQAAWGGWAGSRCSLKKICGEAFMASAAWQTVAAVDSLSRGGYDSACVSVVGCNQQAIAARFTKG